MNDWQDAPTVVGNRNAGRGSSKSGAINAARRKGKANSIAQTRFNSFCLVHSVNGPLHVVLRYSLSVKLKKGD